MYRLNEEQPLSGTWGSIVRFGPAIIVALFYTTVVLHYSYTPDDTYRYLQYAKNLAQGDGFAFNANSPSYGFSCPLWILLIAGGVKAGIDPFIVAKTFDILFASLSLILVYTLAFSVIRDKIFAVVATCVFSFDAWFLRWAGSGMETSFAVLLVLLAVKYAYAGDYHIAGFVAGLLTIVLPEGALLFAVIQTENFFVSYIVEKRRRLFWVSLVLYAVVVVPWLIFSKQYFGTWVPNTVLAKNAVHRTFSDGFGTFVDSVGILSSTQPLLLVLLIVGLPFIIRRGGIGTFIAKCMPLLWIAGLVIGYAVLNVQVVSRTLVPVIPIITVYALWSLKQFELSFGWARQKVLVLLAVVAFGTILQSQMVYYAKVVPHLYAFSKGMDEAMKPIALWLKSETPDTVSILTPDVGLLGYVTDRRFFDTAGLISPPVKRAFAGLSYDEGMKKAVYRGVLKPDFVVDRGLTESRLSSDSLQPIMSKPFAGLGLKRSDLVYYTLYRVIR